MKKKLLVFHPALAPYRIDFFNSLNSYFNAKFFFSNSNLMNQSFNRDELNSQATFKSNYLNHGFNFFGRSIRFGVISIIRKERPDLIISTEFNFLTLLAIIGVNLFSRRTKIYTLTDDNLSMMIKLNPVQYFLRKFMTRRLKGAIFTNKAIASWYQSNFDSSLELLIMPIIRLENKFKTSLDKTNHIVEKYKSLYNLKEKKTILFVGRLTSVKNLELAINAFSHVAKIYPQVTFIIVGSGQLMGNLKNLSNRLNLDDRVLFPGRFEGIELLAWYVLSDNFILPSTSERYGAVISEALLAGCYCAVSELAGASSLIKEGNNGVLFNPHDVDEISDALIKLIQHKTSYPKVSLMNIDYEEMFKIFVSKLN